MFGEKLSEKEYNTLFDDMDCDEDGFIDYDEFLDMIQTK